MPNSSLLQSRESSSDISETVGFHFVYTIQLFNVFHSDHQRAFESLSLARRLVPK